MTKFQRLIDEINACDPAKRWLDRRKLTTLPKAWDAAERAVMRSHSSGVHRSRQEYLIGELLYWHQFGDHERDTVLVDLKHHYLFKHIIPRKKVRALVMKAFRLVKV